VRLSNTATLYSFTIIHPSPKSHQPAFVLAYADFPERVRVMGRLELSADALPKIGMALKVRLTDSAEEAVSFKFVSAEGA
jgi:uncharacterized OB-fold protein